MNKTREHWASQFGFVMAAAGSAIGLGSLWRFPYITGRNGGGAFVLLYLIFTFLIVLPIFIAELIIGRSSQSSPIFAYGKISRLQQQWKGVGWFNFATSLLILSFYSVVSGWCINYILLSLSQFTEGRDPDQIRSVFAMIYHSPGMNLLFTTLFILINIGVVYGGIRKGIEYWSKILTPALLVMLVALFFYGMTLDGFQEAFHFILYPDFTNLSPSGILEALGMAFFTLSVGMGIIITYGSYLKPEESLTKTASIVATMTVLISLIAALTIFPIVFTFNFSPEAGPGLVFQTIPVIFAQLPGNLVLSTLFFTLLLFTALTSSISLFEVLIANLTEFFNWSRKKTIWISSLITLILAIPSALAGSGLLFPTWEDIYGKDFFETLNFMTATWMMPMAALFLTIFIGYLAKPDCVAEEFMRGSGKRRLLYLIWRFLVRYICPLAVVLIILEKAGLVHLPAVLMTG